jgi:hypothetical protein
MDELIAEFWW